MYHCRFRKLNTMKTKNHGLKTLIAIGGWNAASAEFTAMVSSPSNRRKFVLSVMAFLRLHGFDGLDLDWEYPAQRGGSPSDKQNLVLLVQVCAEKTSIVYIYWVCIFLFK